MVPQYVIAIPQPFGEPDREVLIRPTIALPGMKCFHLVDGDIRKVRLTTARRNGYLVAELVE
ncbi:hypothetical protein [Streptomyces xantholiticus]|uniref:Uncharacterized protein n=1 Tax=Streptomyces xantholiticus TaxID=68285 RepID=A0ABV1UZX9_9ACTN